MKFHKGHIYHVYNRGNNKQNTFFDESDYLLFLRKMKKHLKQDCNLLAWCLMPNHFHWLIRAVDDSDTSRILNKKIGTILSSYTQAINFKYDRTGSLFQSRTKAKNLSLYEEKRDYYDLICFLYIHQNPIRANLVKKLEDWQFSSFRDYVGLREGTLCDKELAIDILNLPPTTKDFYTFSNKTISEQYFSKLF